MPRRPQDRTARAPIKGPQVKRPQVRGALIFIGIAYSAIAAAYAITIPLGQAPDESAHLPYVTYVAEHWRLPVFRAGEGSYEYHQAPLYYAAAAPAYLLGRAIAPTRAYIAVRLLGMLLGFAVICMTYLLARDLCPEQPWLAVGAAGFVAFLPMHVALSASVTNDIAAELPFAAGLWQLVIAAREGWSRRRALIVGVLCGLAVLVKSSALILLAIAWFALALQVRQEGARRVLARAGEVTAAAVVVCGWWLARNQALYGDPLASGAFMKAFASNRPTPGSLIGPSLSAFNYVLWVIGWTFASFWGVFGNMNVFLPTSRVYAPLAALTLAALVGAALIAREYQGWDGWRKRIAWALLAAVALVVASFVRFNLSFFQAQGRYLFLALPVIAIVLVGGWGRLFPSAWRAVVYTLICAAMLVVVVAVLPGKETWEAPKNLRWRPWWCRGPVVAVVIAADPTAASQTGRDLFRGRDSRGLKTTRPSRRHTDVTA